MNIALAELLVSVFMLAALLLLAYSGLVMAVQAVARLRAMRQPLWLVRWRMNRIGGRPGQDGCLTGVERYQWRLAQAAWCDRKATRRAAVIQESGEHAAYDAASAALAADADEEE